MTAWPRLRDWVEKDRPFLVWLQRFVGECRTWEVSQENPEDLLTGTSLEDAAKWLKTRQEDLAPREIKFILDSQKADESVRREAAEELTTVAVARRRTSDYIQDERKRHEEEKQKLVEEERKRFTQEKSAALAAAQESYQRVLTILVAAILFLAIGVGVFFWVHNTNKLQVPQQTSTMSGELTSGSGSSSAARAGGAEVRQQTKPETFPWGVRISADKKLTPEHAGEPSASYEVELALDSDLTNIAIYQRPNWYGTVILFEDEQGANLAVKAMATILNGRWKNSTVIKLDKWCPNAQPVSSLNVNKRSVPVFMCPEQTR